MLDNIKFCILFVFTHQIVICLGDKRAVNCWKAALRMRWEQLQVRQLLQVGGTLAINYRSAGNFHPRTSITSSRYQAVNNIAFPCVTPSNYYIAKWQSCVFDIVHYILVASVVRAAILRTGCRPMQHAPYGHISSYTIN